MSVYAEIIGVISNFMYSKLLIILLLACGLWYTFRTKFVQLRMFGESIRVVTEKPSKRQRILLPGADGVHRVPRGHRQH